MARYISIGFFIITSFINILGMHTGDMKTKGYQRNTFGMPARDTINNDSGDSSIAMTHEKNHEKADTYWIHDGYNSMSYPTLYNKSVLFLPDPATHHLSKIKFRYLKNQSLRHDMIITYGESNGKNHLVDFNHTPYKPRGYLHESIKKFKENEKHSGSRLPRSIADQKVKCGEWLNNTRGIIISPNFPNQFPTPIRCQWILFAPPGKQIILYFTQFYMREAFHVAEYELYHNDTFYVGKDEIQELNWEYGTLKGYKPYMVITLDVQQISNIHLRVESFLLDVYGFNITYEIMDQEMEERIDTCSVVKCSFLGNCLVSADFKKYYCQCFTSDYFGDNCQYGPYCDPAINTNHCKNGGICRYYFGSLVNICTCPPGYDGPQCERKKDTYVDSACEALRCSDLCVEGENKTFMCDCMEGYRLKPDNRTCEEQGRMKYHIQIRVNVSEVMLNDSVLICEDTNAELKRVVGRALQDIKHDNVTLIDYRRRGGIADVDFMFMGELADQDIIWDRMQIMISNNHLCSRKINPAFIAFHPSPYLHLISVTNYDEKASIEGKLLTLVCKARGSRQLTFTWSKDGVRIDEALTARNMWRTSIPSYDRMIHISVLNIEEAHYLDEGEFKCEVSDWGHIESKTVYVTVIPHPQLEVTPMALSAHPGESTVISCLSRDDEQAQFEYIWERDEKPIIVGPNREIVEDIFPTGSRLHIANIVESAIYTCIVRSQAGESKDSCVISIIKSDDMVCKQSLHKEIIWQVTKANYSNVKPCPRDAEGQAIRDCVCNTEVCSWSEPNFSQCTTIPLDVITQEFKKLQLGYQTESVSKTLVALKSILMHEIDTYEFIISGDLDKAMALLLDMQDYIKHFMPIEAKETLIKDMFHIVNQVVSSLWSVTGDEIRSVEITANLMKFMERMRPNLQAFTESYHYSPGLLDVQIVNNLPCDIKRNVTIYEDKYIHAWASRNSNICSSNFSTLTVNYKQLAGLLDIRYPGFFPNGRLLYLGIESDEIDVTAHPFYMKQFLKTKTMGSEIQVTHCTMWTHGPYITPHWTSTGCRTIEVTTAYILCQCLLPGHYMVFTPQQFTETLSVHTEEDSGHLILLVCVIIGLCGVAISLCVQIVFWKQLSEQPRFICLSFSLSVMGLFGLLLRAATVQDEQVLCGVVKMLLLLSFLVCFCCGLAESVLLYSKTHVVIQAIYTTTRSKVVRYQDLILAFGVPLVILIPVALTAKFKGFNQTKMCWIELNHWDFYAILIPIGIILVVLVVIYCLTVKNMMNMQTEPQKKNRPRFRFYLFRCIICQGLVYMLLVSVCLYAHYTLAVYKSLLAVLILILALFNAVTSHPSVLLKQLRQCNVPKSDACGVCSPEVQNCINDCSGQCIALTSRRVSSISNATSQSSFKVFVRPQFGHSGSGEDDSESAQRRDEKYTKEKKEQLMALLGQTSSSDGSKESQTSTTFSDNLTSLGDDEGSGDDGSRTTRGSKESHISRRAKHRILPRNQPRHHANPKCACSKCGTNYPFKPARGKSLISVNTDTDLVHNPQTGVRKTVSFSEVQENQGNTEEMGNLLRRQSVPNPFPELHSKQSVLQTLDPLPEASDEEKLHRVKFKRKRIPSDRSNSVKFQIGSDEYNEVFISNEQQKTHIHRNMTKSPDGSSGNKRNSFKDTTSPTKSIHGNESILNQNKEAKNDDICIQPIEPQTSPVEHKNETISRCNAHGNDVESIDDRNLASSDCDDAEACGLLPNSDKAPYHSNQPVSRDEQASYMETSSDSGIEDKSNRKPLYSVQ